ncbi:hypothetical protein LOZ36_003792 [Ophidiomyces ophidiicola]|nr:hypothetical protein LOZ36_003792 [Ophidiomyces ophidiicola]
MLSYRRSIAIFSSTILRILSYVFLRWYEIPGHPFAPIVISCLLIYLASIWGLGRKRNLNAGAGTKPKTSEKPKEKKGLGSKGKGDATTTLPTQRVSSQDTERISAFKSLLTGLPTTSSVPASLATIGVNICLALFSLDFVFRGLILYPTENLSFSRVGHVSSTSARIFVREPNKNLPIRVSYQEIDGLGDGRPMKAGTLYSLDDTSDYTSPISISGLKPSTKYRYSLSNNQSGVFYTAPQPGSPGSKQLRFISSSCIKPNFPYRPFSHPFRIHGVDILTSTLEKLGSSLRPAFMLFLGDFIYIDVPWRFGSSVKHYRDEYRRVYSSPSWHVSPDSPANIPWIHTLDDHEIANDWASGNITAPYPAAADPYLHYHVSVNPPIPRNPHAIASNTTYFSFTHGPASFFLLDTRTYRSRPLNENSTMLGSAQLQSLLEYILYPEPEGVKWKFITSSVPFTKNWHIGTPDTWGGFLNERHELLSAMWRAERDLGVRVVLLSGDRHEFAATRFPDPILASTSTPESFSGPGTGIHEFCAGPLSQFYLPVRTYSQEDIEDIAIKYVPDGNSKFGSISIATDKVNGEEVSRMNYSLYVDGKEVWRYSLVTPLVKKRRPLPPGELEMDIVDSWASRFEGWTLHAREKLGLVWRVIETCWDEMIKIGR